MPTLFNATTSGYTALLIAARTDARELTSLLLDAGADVNAVAPDGTTSLLVATVRGHADLAILLLERGADPNASVGYTALHFAAGSWHTELTGRLRGIETDRDDEWRSMNEVRVGKLRLVEALLAHGADADARLLTRKRVCLLPRISNTSRTRPSSWSTTASLLCQGV